MDFFDFWKFIWIFFGIFMDFFSFFWILVFFEKILGLFLVFMDSLQSY